MLPPANEKSRSWTNEYVRHGTRTVLASLEVKTDKVIAHVRQSRTSTDFLSFLENLNTHKNEQTRAWLKLHPNVSFHSRIVGQPDRMLLQYFDASGPQHAVHKSGKDLERFLKACFASTTNIASLPMDQKNQTNFSHHRTYRSIPGST
jgi:hypothetical protein